MYIIKEYIPAGVDANNKLDGVTYDTNEYPVTIKVSDADRDGVLDVTYDNDPTFTTPIFKNEYEAEGDAKLSAKKEANARLYGKTFKFELYEVTVAEDGTETVGTAPIETTTAVAAGEEVDFTAFHYTMENLKKTDGSYAEDVSYQSIIKEFIPVGVVANH